MPMLEQGLCAMNRAGRGGGQKYVQLDSRVASRRVACFLTL